MGKFGRKLTGAFKKAVGASSSRSHGSSSARYTKPEESPMHEEEETKPTEEQNEEQEQLMEEGDDDPHLLLEGARETQAYNLIKNREFIHTPTYDPNFLQKIGMGIKFATIWKAVGWENVAPTDA